MVMEGFDTKCGGIVLSRVGRVKIDNVSNGNGRELYRIDLVECREEASGLSAE